MSDTSAIFGLVVNSIFVIILSTILFLSLKRVPSTGQRIVIPLVLGSMGVFFIALNNPYLSILAYWGIPACILNAAISVVEHIWGPVFKTHTVAAGSFLTFLFSAYLTLQVMPLFINQGVSLVSQNPFLFNVILMAIFSLIYSLLLFSCMASLPLFCSCPLKWDRRESTTGTSGTGRTAVAIPGKKWMSVCMSGLLLVFTVPLLLLFAGNILSGACSGYECGIISVKDLGYSEPDEGTIIHLTDEKIREYPQLGVALKTGETKLPSCTMEFRMSDAGFFNATTYFEYQGTYYTARVNHYAGYECRRGISFTAVEQ